MRELRYDNGNFDTHDWHLDYDIKFHFEYMYYCKKCNFGFKTNMDIQEHHTLQLPSCDDVVVHNILK